MAQERGDKYSNEGLKIDSGLRKRLLLGSSVVYLTLAITTLPFTKESGCDSDLFYRYGNDIIFCYEFDEKGNVLGFHVFYDEIAHDFEGVLDGILRVDGFLVVGRSTPGGRFVSLFREGKSVAEDLPIGGAYSVQHIYPERDSLVFTSYGELLDAPPYQTTVFNVMNYRTRSVEVASEDLTSFET